MQCDQITSYLHMKADKTKVPVAVFVEYIAASGGYYVDSVLRCSDRWG